MQKTADAAAAVAATSAVLSWIGPASLILQLLATIVAIVSGCFAAYYYWTKARALKDE